MKTYKYLCLLLVCTFVLSCEKNEDGNDGTNPIPGGDSDYTLLVQSPLDFKGVLLNADADVVTFSSAESKFAETIIPTLSFKNGSVFSFYNRTGNCSGTLLRFNFGDETSKSATLFSDLGDCNLTPYAVAHAGDTAYVAYGLTPLNAASEYFVRVVDLNGTTDFIDIPLSKKPVHMEFTNNRLFVLTLDNQVSDENYLTVIDGQTNSELIELNLGFDAQKLFRHIDNNLIIGYNQLHTLLNSETFAPTYVNYQSGKEPEFVSSNMNNFDALGKMYYERPPGEFSSYPLIPAAFDFAGNLTTLYPYENFLTKAERDFEYEIETTSAVGYDDKNSYMLIGYKKIGADKGGLLRVRTGATPAVIDNIDVDGIPVNIIVK